MLQCASRHVTDIEARYPATEIELLAVVWAVHKARLFLAGADHRPLIPIINLKSLDELSTPRIIRMREKLASFRMTAVWRAGIAHKVVDCLSRSPVDQPTTEDVHGETEIEHFQQVLHQLSQLDVESGEALLPGVHLSRICPEGLLDQAYIKLSQVIKDGFPGGKCDLDVDLHPYWGVHGDLSITDGVVMLGGRLVIPSALRSSVLCQLHAFHQGQTRTLRRARQTVYWPNLTNDVQNVVRECQVCTRLLPSQQHEPFLSTGRPNRPLELVAADIFHLAGFE